MAETEKPVDLTDPGDLVARIAEAVGVDLSNPWHLLGLGAVLYVLILVGAFTKTYVTERAKRLAQEPSDEPADIADPGGRASQSPEGISSPPIAGDKPFATQSLIAPERIETKGRPKVEDRPTVFISYSRKDKDWKDRIAPQLRVLQHKDIIILGAEHDSSTNGNRRKNMEMAVDAADVAVLLISADFLTSDSIMNEVVPRLIDRQEQEDLHIFPVIIRPCDWEAVDWLYPMQVQPRDRHPISGGDDHQIDFDLAAIAKEIRVLLSHAVHRFETKRWPLIPPNHVSTAKLPVTGEYLFGRELELDLLDASWGDPDTNVVSLVAWGGVGKSALVNHWLGNLAKENYRGANRVYGWSFYSQGITNRAASADAFIASALEAFDDPNPTNGSPWDKGKRLAHLVRNEKNLLILDGLEPLQFPSGSEMGRIIDPALLALFRELARYNSGLMVVTSRLRIIDLEDYSRTTAPVIELENLSDEVGAALLRGMGVDGPEGELRRASYEFSGHSLALSLLGSYLRDVCNGDVRRRNEVTVVEHDQVTGGQAMRVMTSYENWFGEGPELNLLRIIGLFDRPAERGAIRALQEPPAISGLTNTLQELTDPEWERTLANLRRAGLIAEEAPNDPEMLDAHPLVREHFGQQLREWHFEAWREGNKRLYEYYKAAAPELPNTIEEMAPLYAAVAHGCAAGRHQEALDDVFKGRIQRGEAYFSTRALGAIGAELAALSNFLNPPWSEPVAALTDHDKGYILNQAGFVLRSLGRLTEAIEPMRAALNAANERSDWGTAAINAKNLSELYLTMGDLAQALAYADQGADVADRADNAFLKMLSRTAVADALHEAGRWEEARDLFREAEAMQKEVQPEYPLLYSVQGFKYCDLLLDQGKQREARERAAKTIEIAVLNHWLLDIALDHLSLGRAHLAEALKKGTGEFSKATEHLDRAVDGLRQAGTQDHLPRGLLARAALDRVRGEFERAQWDLDEATSIAERGGMGLHQADAHLEYARLYVAMGDKPKARKHWAKAKEMVEEMGYHRRDGAVAELEKQLEES